MKLNIKKGMTYPKVVALGLFILIAVGRILLLLPLIYSANNNTIVLFPFCLPLLLSQFLSIFLRYHICYNNASINFTYFNFFIFAILLRHSLSGKARQGKARRMCTFGVRNCALVNVRNCALVNVCYFVGELTGCRHG